MNDTKQTILGALQGGTGFLCSLATVTPEGAPWVRYMMGTIDNDMTIRFATRLDSRKVAHIRNRPNVHVLCGNSDPSVDAPYFQIEGTAAINTDLEAKRAAWSDALAAYFQSPESPEWCVLEVHPSRIAIHSMTSMDTKVWTP